MNFPNLNAMDPGPCQVRRNIYPAKNQGKDVPKDNHWTSPRRKQFVVKQIENSSWAPVQNGVHPSEFVFHRNHSLSQVISGIQTHSGELISAWAAMIDSIFSTMFFSVITLQKLWKSLPNRRKSRSEARNHSWVWNKDCSQFSCNFLVRIQAKFVGCDTYLHGDIFSVCPTIAGRCTAVWCDISSCASRDSKSKMNWWVPLFKSEGSVLLTVKIIAKWFAKA